ncbi:MAG: four helix bundle protein [Phycisphaerae bacterium]|nr:four helix bundle protein [Phycisphaerae bacterium]
MVDGRQAKEMPFPLSPPLSSRERSQEMNAFAHEKLVVYQKCLEFGRFVEALLPLWEPKHAVRDQLDRASESMVLNLAEGASLSSSAARTKSLDYALGSTLECAACLDISNAKELIRNEQMFTGKRMLSEIAKMMVGLRKARVGQVREDAEEYLAQSEGNVSSDVFFSHEKLDVYQNALLFVRWFHKLSIEFDFPAKEFQQIDKAATSLVLNIAEGNGRFSEQDHARFLGMAESAAVRAAAWLDLSTGRGTIAEAEADGGKSILKRVQSMLLGLRSYCVTHA